MKGILIVFQVFLASIFSSHLFAQTKHALIFAISDYPKDKGWASLSSVSDALHLQKALLKQGFNEKNIRIVKDAEVTIDGISGAFANLIKTVNPGDIVMVHFSTHGQQVADDNNDEVDKLDECIVTYNAILPKLSKNFQKDQAEYFRDDKLDEYIQQLREKLGPKGDLLITMDDCYSGTGSRGMAVVRGGQPPFVPAGFDFNTTAEKTAMDNKKVVDESKLSSFVVISATTSTEPDWEVFENEDDMNSGMGPLSYALCKVLGKRLTLVPTYRSLFADIQDIMNAKVPQQHPQLEGSGVDRKVFGGGYVIQKLYAEIIDMEDGIEINAGTFQGYDVGAKLVVCKKGAISSTENFIDSATVVKAGNFSSFIKLKNEKKIAEIKQITSAWIFIVDPVYKTEPISIDIVSATTRGDNPGSFTKNEFQEISESLKDLPSVKLGHNPGGLTIVKGNAEDSIKLSNDGLLYAIVKKTQENQPDVANIKNRIKDFVQYKFLAGLEMMDSTAYVEIKLVPIINGVPDTTQIAKEFFEEEKVKIWVKNWSHKDVFFNILDLQPDGHINPVLPYKKKNIQPGDLLIHADSSFIFPRIITIKKPYGKELFKVFVSDSKIDMEDIIATNGASTRGSFKKLESLVQTSYKTRGTEVDNLGSAEGSAYNFYFEIKKKN